MKQLKRQTLESTSRSRKPEAENDNCEGKEKAPFQLEKAIFHKSYNKKLKWQLSERNLKVREKMERK